MALELCAGFESRKSFSQYLNGINQFKTTSDRVKDFIEPPFKLQIDEQIFPNLNDIKIKILHGTTTLAFKFQHGAMVAVDSRATGGSLIFSNTVKKVIEINPFLLGTMAGGAADCSLFERDLARSCRVYELRNKKRISVAAASKILCNQVYRYKGRGLSMGTMIIGWDEKGPGLYRVTDEGERSTDNIFSVGSGSLFAYSILDSNFRWDLSVDEAIDLARRAIVHATHRDAMSGGIVRVYFMKETGWEKISEDDVSDLIYKYKDELTFSNVAKE
ncbi:hypothetical protein GJ496_010379 [Pomphorhynchus laevis]|nr:hypothetical protein GJ496_010379 [Pomphorhynchus laevis]